MTANMQRTRKSAMVKSLAEKVEASTSRKTRSPSNAVADPLNKRRISHNMDPLSRKAALEADRWIRRGSVQPACVGCGGCGDDISLDHRNDGCYYPGFWTKHRGRCWSIQLGILMEEGHTEEEATVILEARIAARREAARQARLAKKAAEALLASTGIPPSQKMTPRNRKKSASPRPPRSYGASRRSPMGSKSPSPCPSPSMMTPFNSPLTSPSLSHRDTSTVEVTVRRRKELHLNPEVPTAAPTLRPVQSTAWTLPPVSSFVPTQPPRFAHQMHFQVRYPPLSPHTLSVDLSRLSLHAENGHYGFVQPRGHFTASARY